MHPQGTQSPRALSPIPARWLEVLGLVGHGVPMHCRDPWLLFQVWLSSLAALPRTGGFQYFPRHWGEMAHFTEEMPQER